MQTDLITQLKRIKFYKQLKFQSVRKETKALNMPVTLKETEIVFKEHTHSKPCQKQVGQFGTKAQYLSEFKTWLYYLLVSNQSKLI